MVLPSGLLLLWVRLSTLIDLLCPLAVLSMAREIDVDGVAAMAGGDVGGMLPPNGLLLFRWCDAGEKTEPPLLLLLLVLPAGEYGWMKS